MIVYQQPQPQQTGLATLGSVLSEWADKKQQLAEQIAAEKRRADYESTLYSRNHQDQVNDQIASEKRRAAYDETLDARKQQEQIEAENRRLEAASVIDRRQRAIAEFERNKEIVRTSSDVGAEKKRFLGLTFDKATPEDIEALSVMATHALDQSGKREQSNISFAESERQNSLDARDWMNNELAKLEDQAARANAVISLTEPTDTDVDNELKLIAPDDYATMAPDDIRHATALRNAQNNLAMAKMNAQKTLSNHDEMVKVIVAAGRAGVNGKRTLQPGPPADEKKKKLTKEEINAALGIGGPKPAASLPAGALTGGVEMNPYPSVNPLYYVAPSLPQSPAPVTPAPAASLLVPAAAAAPAPQPWIDPFYGPSTFGVDRDNALNRERLVQALKFLPGTVGNMAGSIVDSNRQAADVTSDYLGAWNPANWRR